MIVGLLQSMGIIRRQQPDVVLLTGGWVGFPVALAAALLRVPVLIFVPDIEPALSIKVLRHLATKVALAIPESAQYFVQGQTIVTGYPLRQQLTQATRADAFQHFGLNSATKTLLVFGGSRGAQTINKAIMSVLPQLLADDMQVIHVTGTLDFERVCQETKPFANNANYHVHAYLHDDMGMALAVADLVLSRAGAAILGEFPLFGVPSVLVPYPYAWRYQKINAEYLSSRGAAVLLPDEEMPDKLYTMLQQLFTDEERLATMRANVSTLAQHNSAQRIATVLAELSGEESDT